MAKKRGGARPGAGRKPKLQKAVKEAVAQYVFQHFGGEDKAWRALAEAAEKNDLNLLYRVLSYWSDQLHGKAAQPIRHSGVQEGDPIELVMRDLGS